MNFPMGCYMNRELSWLKFNERVLEEAEDERVPLCERMSFASIFQSNLDEFFMVRIGSLKDQTHLKKEIRDNKTRMTAQEQIDAALAQVRSLTPRRETVYQRLMQQLNQAGVRLVDFRSITEEESKNLERYFKLEVLPLLSPVVLGKRQPWPFLRNRELYAVAVLRRKNGKRKLGLVPCGTGVFPRLIKIAQGEYILCEELILHFLPKVFKGYDIESKSVVRLTRSADIDADALYDEDLDYRSFMEKIVKKRKKLEPVRMELTRDLGPDGLREVRTALGVDEQAVFVSGEPLDLSFFFQLEDTLRQQPEYFYPKRIPQKSAMLKQGVPIMDQIAQGDKLLSYPFERIDPFIQMLREAAVDDNVVSIKMTLYRVARNSQVVSALIQAAENGKEVLVLVELKARFDEENNIEWSRRLEEAGCHVIYGLPGYKVHSKLCLISRMVNGQHQYITQVGTGNYNEKTARLYTDLTLMTANQEIGQDAAAVFTALSMGETVQESGLLMVAPNCLQAPILNMIDQEIAFAQNGQEAYVGVKVNSLTDKAIIDKLIEASRAGVKVEMVVRGICCLLPGIPGQTENIRIISIVGRFLEHSRIYIFGTGQREQVYIASADFMTRNTLRRVEVAAPVLDPALKDRLKYMFKTMMSDNCQARELKADGWYCRVKNDLAPINSQEVFFQKAYDRAEEAAKG